MLLYLADQGLGRTEQADCNDGSIVIIAKCLHNKVFTLMQLYMADQS
jgi:hypothetical protein